MKSFRSALTILTLTFVASAALSEDYADPSGFKLTVPEGWVAVSKVNRDNVPEATKKWLADNKVNLDKINVTVMKKEPGAGSPSMNVVVIPQALPANEATAKLLGTMLPGQFKAGGIKVDDFKIGVEKVAGNDAIVATFKSTVPSVAKDLKQKQTYLPVNGKTYVITHSASADEFNDVAPILEKITTSMKFGDAK